MGKKKVPLIWCHYKGAWLPMGRARKRCPSCGAVIMKGDVGHRMKKGTLPKAGKRGKT